jgi:hypothetical protein
MTEDSVMHPRVRPGFRRAAIVIVVLLLPVAAHALWDYVESRRLSSAVEAIRQRGERVYLGYGRPMTPEQKQASRYYGAAAHLVREAYGKALATAGRDIESLSALPPAAARNDPRLDALQQVAEQYAPALELLDRAARLDARGLDYGDDSIYGFPNKSLADVNALRIARLAFLGESDAASHALVATLRIRRAYTDQRGLNLPVDSGTSLRLILAFAPPTEPGLRALQEEYSKWDVEGEVEDRLVDMRARLIGAVWPGAPGEMPVTPRFRDPQDRGRMPRLVDLVLRPWVTRNFTRLLRQYEETIAAAKQPWPAKLDAARALAERYPDRPSQSRPVSGLLGFSSFSFRGLLGVNPSAIDLARLAPAFGTEIARRRVAITALAVERYRRANSNTVPSSLTALVPTYLKSVPTDPFSGQPIRYVQGRDTYKVYSVGENRQDENGDWTEIEVDRSHPHFVRRAPRDLGFDVPVR